MNLRTGTLLRGATALTLTLVAAGCSSFQGRPERPALLESSAVEVIKSAGDEELKTALSRKDGLTIIERNNLIDARILAIDQAYLGYEVALFNEGRNQGFLAALADLSVDVTGTLINGSTALSAASAAITGADGAFNSEILVEKTITALIQQMRANRDAQLALINERMLAPVSGYTLAKAVADLEAYFYAGTIASAIVSVTQTTADEEKNARVDAEEAQTIRFKLDNPALTIRQAIYTSEGAGTLDANGVAKLNQCAKKTGVALPAILPDFVTADDYATDREKIAACLKTL